MCRLFLSTLILSPRPSLTHEWRFKLFAHRQGEGSEQTPLNDDETKVAVSRDPKAECTVDPSLIQPGAASWCRLRHSGFDCLDNMFISFCR